MENFETKEARDRASRKTEQSLGAAGGNLGLASQGPEGGEDGAGKAWSRDNGQAFGELAENVYLEVPNLSNSKPARRGRGTKKPSRGPRTSTAETRRKEERGNQQATKESNGGVNGRKQQRRQQKRPSLNSPCGENVLRRQRRKTSSGKRKRRERLPADTNRKKHSRPP